MLAGTFLIYGGLLFLALGLIAAAKEVFEAKPSTTTEGGALEGTIADVNSLLQTVGKLKTWVVLALIGFVMICLGGFLTRDLPLERVLGGAIPSNQQTDKK